MEKYLRNLGYYGSLAWIVVMFYGLGIHLLTVFGIRLFQDTPESILINLNYMLLTIVYVIVIPTILYAAEKELKMPWGVLLSSMFLLNLAKWMFHQDLKLKVVVRVIALICGIYAFWKFRRLRLTINKEDRYTLKTMFSEMWKRLD
jgi:membrane-anchored protein YejM (alkaline phosphatase superfamily)